MHRRRAGQLRSRFGDDEPAVRYRTLQVRDPRAGDETALSALAI
jgi:hypothetical protein